VHEVDAPYTTRNIAYSLYIRDQWQVNSKMTLSFGTRWEYFPMPTRAGRGLERYNPQTNLMEIGGVGSVPTDLGVKMSKTLFAPRLGATYRSGRQDGHSRRLRDHERPVRARPADAHQPPDPAEPDRAGTHHVRMDRHHPGWHPAHRRSRSRRRQNLRSQHGRDLHAARRVHARVHRSRGTPRSSANWSGVFVGEVAYVGTNQVNQLGYRELNWSPINGGQAGRQLNQLHGRQAQTRLVSPVGDSMYHGLQTQLNRRFANGSSSVRTTPSRATAAWRAHPTATTCPASTSRSTTT
jgi:hypothetical protein